MNRVCFVLFIGFTLGFMGCYTSSPSQTSIHLDKAGHYSHGHWQYELVINNPGTRSESRHGMLFYKHTLVPMPSKHGDYYNTPWGRIGYVGLSLKPEIAPMKPGQDTGWVQLSDVQIGQLLPLPDTDAGRILIAKSQMSSILDAMARKDPYDFLPELEQEHATTSELDPWVIPYRQDLDERGRAYRLILISAGPDKAFDTEDDIERHTNFMSYKDTHMDEEGIGEELMMN